MAKTTAKANTRKKADSKEKKATEENLETVAKEDSLETVKEEQPKRQKRKEIERTELIACRSVTNGRLIYRSPRSLEKFVWDDFGAVEYIEMGELQTMKSSYPKFMNDVQIIIDDEEAAEYLGLNKIYNEMLQVDDLDALFEKTNDELAVILPKLPNGLKKSVGTRARKLVEEDVLDSISKIKLIEQELGIDLQLFIN